MLLCEITEGDSDSAQNLSDLEVLLTVWFEVSLDPELRIDIGKRRVGIEDDDPGHMFLFVATLGYSRRVYAQAFRHEER